MTLLEPIVRMRSLQANQKPGEEMERRSLSSADGLIEKNKYQNNGVDLCEQ